MKLVRIFLQLSVFTTFVLETCRFSTIIYYYYYYDQSVSTSETIFSSKLIQLKPGYAAVELSV